MSKRENKRIRQLERRVEKLEQALYGGRVPDYQIQVTAGGTPEMLDELGKKLAESIQKAFSVPASEAKASEPMEFTVTTEEAAQSLARAVEADKSASLPAETVIREMEKGRHGASDRKTVRERLRDVFPSSSYR